MNKRFDKELKDFREEQKALQKINEKSRQMESGKLSKKAEADRVEIELDHVPTRDGPPKKSKKVEQQIATTYDPRRVKSSIPTAANIPKQKKMIQKQVDYIEELKTQETKRAVRVEQEQEVTLNVLEKMRDNPNAELFNMHNEVAMLNRKIEPLLKRVELASEMVKKTGHHKALSQ